jgi:maltooligosyltrehalose trehalohydrolase
MHAKEISQPAPAAARPGERRRRHPIGAELQPGGGVHFRVWAPAAAALAVEWWAAAEPAGARRAVALAREADGYFSGYVPEARAGARYVFRFDAERARPDPASRCQPEGPHGPSVVVDPAFAWTDGAWRGVAPRDVVLYELHLGTFTREGTWAAAQAKLPELARLGITMLEVMPVAEFPGRFGWGYDGVDLFAPSRLYGTPDDARAFVDRAHALGLGVILDVVYNHFGPDGNYLREFSPHYFSTKYANEWGDPLNFDGDHSGPVREYFITNARYWVEEFHFDGLRLDATQQIFDATQPHVVAEVGGAVRAAAPGRRTYVIGENETQHARFVRPVAAGGCGLDALWNDDFHHAAHVAATGRAEAYYSGFRGAPQEFVSCAKHGFLYQGQWYAWQRQRRGRPAFDLAPAHFVHFLQNHDQVANSLRGLRLHQLTSPGLLRALTALTLLAPQTPLLFQGQEFAASAPFLYFADHQPELAQRVRAGRARFLQQFDTIAAPEAAALLADPGAEETFARCRLDWSERTSARGAAVWQLHADLLRLRREESALRDAARCDGAVLGAASFALRFFSAGADDDRLLLVNLGVDACLMPVPEPLLAPLEGRGWRVRWSSEAPVYGGGGINRVETASHWLLPGHAAVLLCPDENCELLPARLSEKD